MGTRTEYAPGTFCWADLSTSDSAGAKAFYSGLLGWECEDNEAPDGSVYSMCKVEGESVAGISSGTGPVPPHWNNYVSVTSADESAARAVELGATPIEQPFDIGDAGRVAVFQDPTGAMLCLWEPGEMIGAGRVNEPGCLTWNELHTPDPAEAVAFYTALFGWSAEEMDTGEGNPGYTVLRNGERTNGGVMDAQPGEPPNWLPYFVVESRDGAVARAKELGSPQAFSLDMDQGRIAVLADPQGAALGLFEGEVDD